MLKCLKFNHSTTIEDGENIMDSKIGWIEAARLSIRSYRIIHKLDSWFLPLQTLDSIIAAVSPFVNLYMGALIINQLALGLDDISRIATYVAVTVGLNFTFSLCRNIMQKRLSVFEITSRLNYFAFLSKHYMQLDYEHTENPQINASVADIEGKTTSTSAGMMDAALRYGSIIQNAVGILAAFVILWGMSATGVPIVENFFTSSWATILLAALLVANILLSIFRQKYVQKAVEFIRSEGPKINSLLGYYIKYMRHNEAAKDIRLFGQQSVIKDVLGKFFETRHSWFRYYHVRGRESAISEFASAVFSGLAYLLIGLRALWGMYGVGSVLAYVGAVRNLSGNISGLVNALAQTKNNAVFLPQVFEYLDVKNAKQSGDKSPNPVDHVVEFHNVSFKYPGATEYALKNLSFRFHAKQKMAVVGQNGSGKTTMIKLLCRLYEPAEGKITLDGIDIQEYQYDEYLSLFAVVLQDFKLFGFSLGQNLACDDNYDATRAKHALSESGFDMPPSVIKGLDTPLFKDLDKEGITLSGGEAQKVAIAKAFYKNSPFMLLDEPTAALDPLSEFEVYNRINDNAVGKAVVYISHRLASCRFCNNIIVLHKGEIVQSGGHESLIVDTDGKYHELWNAQARYYEN